MPNLLLWFWLLLFGFYIKLPLYQRQQRTKANNVYSTFSDKLYGVPQGSILGPLHFNSYISDMFYDINNCDIATVLATTHHTPVTLT